MKGFHLKRPLSAEQITALRQASPDDAENIAANLQQAIPAISLVSSVALATAFANDVNSEFIFAQQVFGLGNCGDVFLGISTSGNSRNIIQAIKVAKSLGMVTVGLTGESGGAMKSICDITICVPASSVVDIQEMHLPVYHALCAELEERFFGKHPKATLPLRCAVNPSSSATSEAVRSGLPEHIEQIIFDFDGVFTDNKVWTDQDGSESVLCDRRDGLGLDMMRKQGYPMFILSTETNPVVKARGRKLKLEVISSCDNKADFLRSYFAEHSINPKNVIYVGNDINDLEAMQLVGYPVAPHDAHPEILRIAALVLRSDGGNGAVRELCETILTNKR